MPKFYFATGILATTLFVIAQIQQWNVFDSIANQGGKSSSSYGRSVDHLYHK